MKFIGGQELGFDPLKQTFLVASQTIRGRGDSKKARKIKWGWSMTDIWIAFRKHPRIFFLPETNIHVKMELFVTKMLRNISDIILRPKLLDLSMEKRIIPRFEVA